MSYIQKLENITYINSSSFLCHSQGYNHYKKIKRRKNFSIDLVLYNCGIYTEYTENLKLNFTPNERVFTAHMSHTVRYSLFPLPRNEHLMKCVTRVWRTFLIRRQR